MHKLRKILVVQTAFLGDVVLTLPLVQITKRIFPESEIDVVSIPRTSSVLHNHPAIREVIEFDKRGKDKGISDLLRLARTLRDRRYDVALVPHRSLRSAVVVWLAKIPVRIGFHKSAGRFLFTDVVQYQNNVHEIERNISLLKPLNVVREEKELPSIYPSPSDIQVVDKLFLESKISANDQLVAIAPGTVWNTKRWLKERYAELARKFASDQFRVVLIGGPEDTALCEEIRRLAAHDDKVLNVTGKLTFLQSAELLRRCKLLVCNDSAPMHLAVAVRTPVVAIFGATVPEFGFAPHGQYDAVVETKGLSCRPCSSHGGDVCPIRTFVCMKEISTEMVFVKAKHVLAKPASGRQTPMSLTDSSSGQR